MLKKSFSLILHSCYKVDGEGFVVPEDWTMFLEDLYPGQSEVQAMARGISVQIAKIANDKAKGKTNYTIRH